MWFISCIRFILHCVNAYKVRCSIMVECNCSNSLSTDDVEVNVAAWILLSTWHTYHWSLSARFTCTSNTCTHFTAHTAYAHSSAHIAHTCNKILMHAHHFGAASLSWRFLCLVKNHYEFIVGNELWGHNKLSMHGSMHVSYNVVFSNLPIYSIIVQ